MARRPRRLAGSGPCAGPIPGNGTGRVRPIPASSDWPRRSRDGPEGVTGFPAASSAPDSVGRTSGAPHVPQTVVPSVAIEPHCPQKNLMESIPLLVRMSGTSPSWHSSGVVVVINTTYRQLRDPPLVSGPLGLAGACASWLGWLALWRRHDKGIRLVGGRKTVNPTSGEVLRGPYEVAEGIAIKAPAESSVGTAGQPHG